MLRFPVLFFLSIFKTIPFYLSRLTISSLQMLMYHILFDSIGMRDKDKKIHLGTFPSEITLAYWDMVG